MCGVLSSVRPVADQLRRLLPGWAGIAAGVDSGLHRSCVRDWLGEQSEAFQKMIKVVVIDPSAPHASGIRAALPDAKIAVDKWHLAAVANQMVTDVRQRVTRDLLGRRGTVADPVWVNRRLLTAAEHLSLTVTSLPLNTSADIRGNTASLASLPALG